MDEKKRIALWEEYARTKSSKIREKLILEYAGLVKIVAGRLGMYLGYTVEYDDLVGYGSTSRIQARVTNIKTYGEKKTVGREGSYCHRLFFSQVPFGLSSAPSFDKQFARDWLKANDGHDWTLPKDIVDKTIDKYLQAYELLTGEKL